MKGRFGPQAVGSKIMGSVSNRQRSLFATTKNQIRGSAMERSMPAEGNRAGEMLTSSEQELRLLVEAIPALVWRAGPDGNIEYVNQRLLDYLGAPRGEVIGWGWMEKVHPDDVAFKVKTWLENLESGNPHDAVCRFRRADGQYRWFEVHGEPLRASDGTVLSWSGFLIDIDDRRK